MNVNEIYEALGKMVEYGYGDQPLVIKNKKGLGDYFDITSLNSVTGLYSENGTRENVVYFQVAENRVFVD